MWSRAPVDDLERARMQSASRNNGLFKPCIGAAATLYLTFVWSFKLLSSKVEEYVNTSTDSSPPMAPQETEPETRSDEESSAPVDAQPIPYFHYPLAHAASKRAGRLLASRFLTNETRFVFDDSPFSLNPTPKSRESSFFNAPSLGSRATSPPVSRQPPAAAETVEERIRSSSISTPRPAVMIVEPSIV